MHYSVSLLMLAVSTGTSSPVSSREASSPYISIFQRQGTGGTECPDSLVTTCCKDYLPGATSPFSNNPTEITNCFKLAEDGTCPHADGIEDFDFEVLCCGNLDENLHVASNCFNKPAVPQTKPVAGKAPEAQTESGKAPDYQKVPESTPQVQPESPLLAPVPEYGPKPAVGGPAGGPMGDAVSGVVKVTGAAVNLGVDAGEGIGGFFNGLGEWINFANAPAGASP